MLEIVQIPLGPFEDTDDNGVKKADARDGQPKPHVLPQIPKVPHSERYYAYANVCCQGFLRISQKKNRTYTGEAHKSIIRAHFLVKTSNLRLLLSSMAIPRSNMLCSPSVVEVNPSK